MWNLPGLAAYKLKQYEAARESALELENSNNPIERARAWNTLCVVELASLAPVESTFACDQTIDEEGDISDQANDYDTYTSQMLRSCFESTTVTKSRKLPRSRYKSIKSR